MPTVRKDRGSIELDEANALIDDIDDAMVALDNLNRDLLSDIRFRTGNSSGTPDDLGFDASADVEEAQKHLKAAQALLARAKKPLVTLTRILG